MWLSVASALEIANTRKARNSIFSKVNKKNLYLNLQKESNDIYNNIMTFNKSNNLEE